MSLGGGIGVFRKFYYVLLNESSDILSFGANLLSFEAKKFSLKQKLVLSFVFLEFFAA